MTYILISKIPTYLIIFCVLGASLYVLPAVRKTHKRANTLVLSLAEDLKDAVFAPNVFQGHVAPADARSAMCTSCLYSITSSYVVTEGQSHLACVEASFNQYNLPQSALPSSVSSNPPACLP